MARVLRRPQAAEDISDIWDYIADDNIEAADRWIDKLDDQLQLLATQPMMGRARNELAEGIRCVPVAACHSVGMSFSICRSPAASMSCGYCTRPAT